MWACVFQKTHAANRDLVLHGRFYDTGWWAPSAMGPRSFVMAKPLVGPGVCVLTELSAQALTQDSPDALTPWLPDAPRPAACSKPR
jgi:hypothetical protein